VWPTAGATISSNAPQFFTIQASDPNGDPYTGTVTVRNATTGQVVYSFSTAPAASGQQSSGAPPIPFQPGSYTWMASATDVFGSTGPQAQSQAFTVAGAPDLGGGAVTGAMSFTEPIQALNQPCAQTSFTLSGTSGASVISFTETEFTGLVTFSGSGGGSCETFGRGSGSIQLSAQGLGITATTLSCPTLLGNYTRVGTDLSAVVTGSCSINGQADSLSLDVRVELVPTSGGASQPTTAADFEGGFAVSAAT
jgi:hypothetical protein